MPAGLSGVNKGGPGPRVSLGVAATLTRLGGRPPRAQDGRSVSPSGGRLWILTVGPNLGPPLRSAPQKASGQDTWVAGSARTGRGPAAGPGMAAERGPSRPGPGSASRRHKGGGRRQEAGFQRASPLVTRRPHPRAPGCIPDRRGSCPGRGRAGSGYSRGRARPACSAAVPARSAGSPALGPSRSGPGDESTGAGGEEKGGSRAPRTRDRWGCELGSLFRKEPRGVLPWV